MSSTETGPDEPEQTPETPDPAAGRRKVWLFSAAAVVVLVVAGVVVYLLTSGDDADNASGTDVPTITGSQDPTPSQSVPQPPAPGASSASATATAPPPAEDDPGQARSVAEDAAAAISSGDAAAIAVLACDPANAQVDETYPSSAKVEVVGEPQFDGDKATIDVRVTIEGNQPAVVPMPLAKQDGRWCIP